MKKNYVSPHLEVLRIKQGNVVMTSPNGCSIDSVDPCRGDCTWECDEECRYESGT